MELRVNEVAIPERIEFNYDELKAELTSKVKFYETLVYTDDQIKDAKADRANLNKLKKALNDERIRREKEYMKPFEEFKTQINEIISIINKPVAVIDEQVKAFEEKKKADKQKAIEELFGTIGFQNFVTLDKIQDPKWLNASTTMKNIEDQMKAKMYKIGDDVLRISQFPEFSFEAMETYKETLLIDDALDTVQKNRQMAQKKVAAMAEEERKTQERAQEQQRAAMAQTMTPPENTQSPQADEPKKFPVKFEAILTKKQAEELGAWFKERNITFRAI